MRVILAGDNLEAEVIDELKRGSPERGDVTLEAMGRGKA